MCTWDVNYPHGPVLAWTHNSQYTTWTSVRRVWVLNICPARRVHQLMNVQVKIQQPQIIHLKLSRSTFLWSVLYVLYISLFIGARNWMFHSLPSSSVSKLTRITLISLRHVLWNYSVVTNAWYSFGLARKFQNKCQQTIKICSTMVNIISTKQLSHRPINPLLRVLSPKYM